MSDDILPNVIIPMFRITYQIPIKNVPQMMREASAELTELSAWGLNDPYGNFQNVSDWAKIENRGQNNCAPFGENRERLVSFFSLF